MFGRGDRSDKRSSSRLRRRHSQLTKTMTPTAITNAIAGSKPIIDCQGGSPAPFRSILGVDDLPNPQRPDNLGGQCPDQETRLGEE